MATLGLKEMGKFLWEGREKVLPSWLSQSHSLKNGLLSEHEVISKQRGGADLLHEKEVQGEQNANRRGVKTSK